MLKNMEGQSQQYKQNYSGDPYHDEHHVNDEMEIKIPKNRPEPTGPSLEEVAEDHGNLIDKLFPRSPKAIGKRRYLMVICVGFLLIIYKSFEILIGHVTGAFPI